MSSEPLTRGAIYSLYGSSDDENKTSCLMKLTNAEDIELAVSKALSDLCLDPSYFCRCLCSFLIRQAAGKATTTTTVRGCVFLVQRHSHSDYYCTFVCVFSPNA